MPFLATEIQANFAGHLKQGSVEAQLFQQIDLHRIPQHVAIIMDGNGRWAQKRRLPRVAGHRAGIQSVREAVETAARLKMKVLTLYAFSVENWKRPVAEVSTLMGLLKEFLKKELKTLLKNDIKFETLGRTFELDPTIQKELQIAKDKTAQNSGLLFNVALNYGGRAELVDAFKLLMQKQLNANGNRNEISEKAISNSLYTAGLPDPDLLIRTSGDLRVSNFLLWQIAYSEIWVTNTLWPDFRKRDFFEAYRLNEAHPHGRGSCSSSDFHYWVRLLSLLHAFTRACLLLGPGRVLSPRQKVRHRSPSIVGTSFFSAVDCILSFMAPQPICAFPVARPIGNLPFGSRNEKGPEPASDLPQSLCHVAGAGVYSQQPGAAGGGPLEYRPR